MVNLGSRIEHFTSVILDNERNGPFKSFPVELPLYHWPKTFFFPPLYFEISAARPALLSLLDKLWTALCGPDSPPAQTNVMDLALLFHEHNHTLPQEKVISL